MRVLLVAHQYPPDGLAGVERYTESLANALANGGDDVAVVARRLEPAPFEPVLRRERAEGVKVYRLVGGGVDLDDPLLHDRRLERLLATVLAEHAPDVVQLNHLVGMPLRLPAVARRLRAAVVAMLLDYYFACPLEYLRKRSGDQCAGPDGGRECARTCFAGHVDGDARWTLRERIFHALLAAVDMAVSPSRHAAEYFRTLWPEVDPTIVPLGLEDVQRVPDVERASAEPLHVAYVGAVAEHKGVHMLVESAVRVDAPLTLTILGQVYDAAYADRLRALAAGRASLDFRLVGAFDEGELSSLLADVDVAAFPSQVREVFPLAPREVLARGVPVLVARLGALPEAVEDGVNGLTFDASGELTALLSRLARDRSLVSTLRSGARATRVPTVAEHVDRIRGVYENVIARRHDDAGLIDVERLHAQLVALSVRE